MIVAQNRLSAKGVFFIMTNHTITNLSVVGRASVGEGWQNKALNGYNRMYYINGGIGGYIENGKRILFTPGTLYFLPYYSNFVLYTSLQDNLDVTYADFRLKNPVFSSTIYNLSTTNDPSVNAAVNSFRLLCTLPTRNEAQNEYLKATLSYLISEVINAQPWRLINDQTVITALDIMRSSIAQKITISDIAQKCFMSTDGFIRRFTRTVGESPYAYLKKLRIQTALSMRFDWASIEQTAEACGYSSASALLHAIASYKTNSRL